jgi:hypothetical protein
MRLAKGYIPPIIIEHARNRFGRKFFLLGLVLGLTPYLIHIKIWA